MDLLTPLSNFSKYQIGELNKQLEREAQIQEALKFQAENTAEEAK